MEKNKVRLPPLSWSLQVFRVYQWADQAWSIARLFISIGGAVAMIWWAAAFDVLKNLSLGERVMFWVLIAIFLVPTAMMLVYFLILLHGKKRFTGFYDDRNSANRSMGHLEKVIRDADEVWAAWHTGTYASSQTDVLEYEKNGVPIISRLVLMKPDLAEGSYLTKFHAPYFSGTAKDIASDIDQTTTRALETGIDQNPGGKREVKHFPGPLMNSLLIVNPRKNSGYIRLEIQMPYSRTPNLRPIVIIKASERKASFDRILEIFENICQASEAISPSAPYTPSARP